MSIEDGKSPREEALERRLNVALEAANKHSARITELTKENEDLKERLRALGKAEHMKDFFVFIYPQQSDFQHIYDKLFQKFAEARPGQFIPLTHNEMALIGDIQIFPKR